MPIEEITKIGVAIATILGTAIAAIIRSNKKSEEPDAEVDTEQLSKELQEVQKVYHTELLDKMEVLIVELRNYLKE